MRLGTLPAAALILAASGLAARAEPIGATLKIVNQVTAEFNRDTRSLAEGDGVNRDELIQVGQDALGELVFKDETKLALGPGSQMKLDTFVYDPDKSSGSIAVNLVKGTFRFITGIADKSSYTIRTPAASIAVRGTIFDVAILDDGTTWLLLHEGAVAVSNQRGKCRLLSSPGRLIRVTGNGDVGIPVNWNGMPGSDRVEFDQAFPFVAAPPSMDPKPVFTRAAVLAIPAGGGPGAESCDDKGEQRTAPAPRRADDDGDRRPAKPQKPVRRAVQEQDDRPTPKLPPKKPVRESKPRETKSYDPPIKVVIPVKPKKPKPNRGGNYGDKDDNVKVMDGIGIAIGIAGGFGKMKGGNKGPSRGDGGYGGKGMDGGGYGKRMMPQ
jgi:FecR protein